MFHTLGVRTLGTPPLLTIAGIYLVATAASSALTAQEIAGSVIEELNNVSDYQADVDVSYDDVAIADMTGGSLMYKRATGSVPMINFEMGSGYRGHLVSDGTGWNVLGSNSDYEYHTEQSDGLNFVRKYFGTDMFNMEAILATETWTKATSAETVNSVTCYKLYTTKGSVNYEVWIDTGTVKKIIRVKATDMNDALQWQLDYSSYGLVEGTAQLPSVVIAKRFENSTQLFEATYTFANIDINAGLSDNVFAIWEP